MILGKKLVLMISLFFTILSSENGSAQTCKPPSDGEPLDCPVPHGSWQQTCWGPGYDCKDSVCVLSAYCPDNPGDTYGYYSEYSNYESCWTESTPPGDICSSMGFNGHAVLACCIDEGKVTHRGIGSSKKSRNPKYIPKNPKSQHP